MQTTFLNYTLHSEFKPIAGHGEYAIRTLRAMLRYHLAEVACDGTVVDWQ
jgi:hypothetical protein